MQGRGVVILFTLTILLSTMLVTPIVSGTQDDDCPEVDGNSHEDRVGCLDSDGDGWSDPDEDWTVDNGADAFPKENTQWADKDGDGWGDSSSFDANLIDHFPDDSNLHRAVLSVGCNPPDHTLSIGKSSHFLCTVKNEGMVPIRLYPNWDASSGVAIERIPQYIDLKTHGTIGEQSELRLDFTASEVGVTGGNLYFNKSNYSEPIYSVQLGVLVVTSTPHTSSSDPTPSLDPVMEKANSFASWLTAKTNFNFTAQSALTMVIVGPLVLFVIARRTQTLVRQRRENIPEIEESTANEDEREEHNESESLSLEDMAADPNQSEKKPKRGVKGAEGKVLASGMVEVMVGEIDMPNTPSDTFDVLSENLGDSEIEEGGWDSELDDIEEDDTDFKVSAKHRISENVSEIIEAETPTITPTHSKKESHKAEKKRGSTPSKKKKSQVTKKEKKKRAKGKVGHTRGPGIDLK